MRWFVVLDKEKQTLASFHTYHQLVNSCPLSKQKRYAAIKMLVHPNKVIVNPHKRKTIVTYGMRAGNMSSNLSSLLISVNSQDG